MEGAAPDRPWWRRSGIWWRVIRDGLSIAAAVAMLIWGLPRVASVSWSEIIAPLRHLQPWQLLLMAVLQLAALISFTFTITGSLPGITHRRALTVNLAGSLVANTLPFGGALAIGATYGMCRSWGFSRSAIGISIVLGGVFSSIGKVVLPIVGLLALLLQGGTISPALRDAAVGTIVVLLLAIVLFVWVLLSPSAAHAVGRVLERAAEWVLARLGRPRTLRWEAAVATLRDRTKDIMRAGWLPMLLGVLGYLVIYFVLFWLCLHSVGLVMGLGTMLAAFALGRLLTSVAVTPGGLGLVEAGTVALLVAMGADPALAAGGVLLFTIFTHVLEIPFGVIAWLAWLWGRPRRRAAAPAQPGTVSNTSA